MSRSILFVCDVCGTTAPEAGGGQRPSGWIAFSLNVRGPVSSADKTLEDKEVCSGDCAEAAIHHALVSAPFRVAWAARPKEPL